MNRLLLVVVSLLLVLSAVLIVRGPISHAQTANYIWTISMTTEEIPSYFTFQGTSLTPIVKVHVTYNDQQTTKNKDEPYEDLFFRGCDAIGLRRYKVLNITNTGLGAIQVVHKASSASEGETCAAANTVVRLLLDTYVLGDAPAAVMVPSDSYSAIAQDLRHENFFPLDTTQGQVPASVILTLTSGGSQQTMYYSSGN